MPNPVTFEMLASAIRRDPQSWQGIGLRYSRPFPAPTPQETHLFIRGNHKDGVLVGALPHDSTLAEDASILFRVQDIATEASLVVQFLESIAPAPTAMARPQVSPQASTSRMFLVVEDDPMTSRLVAQHLQAFGRVITTKNAREATANYTVNTPDIIFLDIHYRDDIYDGFDVLTNILSANPKAFVIMVSGDKNPTTILRALSLGARGFIAKPFQAAIFAHYLSQS